MLQAWMCLGEGRLGVVAWPLAMQFVLPTLQACGIPTAILNSSGWPKVAKLQIRCCLQACQQRCLHRAGCPSAATLTHSSSARRISGAGLRLLSKSGAHAH